MLPSQHRLRSTPSFGHTIKRGRKKGSRTVVVYVHSPETSTTWGGPRMGVVVSKAVGNSVVRHNTARKIRAAMANVLADPGGVELKESQNIVIRALPHSATATTREVEKDVRSCLRRITAPHRPRE